MRTSIHTFTFPMKVLLSKGCIDDIPSTRFYRSQMNGKWLKKNKMVERRIRQSKTMRLPQLCRNIYRLRVIAQRKQLSIRSSINSANIS